MTYHQGKALAFTAKMLEATSSGKQRDEIEDLFEYFYNRIYKIINPEQPPMKMSITMEESIKRKVIDSLKADGITWSTEIIGK